MQRFTPDQFKDLVEDQTALYFKVHPQSCKFELHNLRGTEVSLAKMAEESFKDAAIAFGCHPATMRMHSPALNVMGIENRVMAEI